MVRTIIGVIILIAIIRLQIFLSKKDNKLFGLIIPIILFASSLIFAFGFIPTHNKIETTQSVMTETGKVVESSSDKTSSIKRPLSYNNKHCIYYCVYQCCKFCYARYLLLLQT